MGKCLFFFVNNPKKPSIEMKISLAKDFNLINLDYLLNQILIFYI